MEEILGNHTSSDNPTYSNLTIFNSFRSNKFFLAYGNIMSLIYSTNYDTNFSIRTPSAFAKIFCDCTNLKTSGTKHLMLNAAPGSQNGRYLLACAFYNCINMEYLPILDGPNVTYCMYKYYYTFYNCDALKAVDFKTQGYSQLNAYMFCGSSSIKTVVVRSHNNSGINGSGMLQYLSNVEIIIYYPPSFPSSNNMMSGSKENGTFYCRNDITVPVGTYGIPSSWTRKDIIEIDHTYVY